MITVAGNKRCENDFCGILLVNKPAGFTSFDVIAKLRGILKMKKLGHAGTLDPMATGVLPVFAGKATAACDILPINEKSYTATFTLGKVYDTQDCTGSIVAEYDKRVTLEDVKKAAEGFVGDIMQIPPMYSAVSIGGKRLYELAREGKEVERKPRPMKIERFEIEEFDEATQSGKVLISCSKGTYIRTLIHDMGMALQTGGYMTSLVRNSSSGFELCDCKTLDEIQRLADNGEIKNAFIPIENAFSCYRKITISPSQAKMYRNGVRLSLKKLGVTENETYNVFSDDEFLGLARCDFEKDELVSVKNFYKNQVNE